MADLTLQQLAFIARQHFDAGRVKEAEDLCRSILQHDQNHAEARDLMAQASAFRIQQAEKAVHAAQPVTSNQFTAVPNVSTAQSFCNEGVAFLREHQPDLAITSFRRALLIDANHVATLNNLSLALKDIGELELSIACLRQAMEIRSDVASCHSNLLYLLHFHPDYNAAKLYREHLEFRQRHAESLKAEIKPHQNDRSPNRRLRIGYVSPDFRAHPVGRFLLGLFSHHNHEQFEIFCYSSVRKEDVITETLRKGADRWASVFHLSDEALAKRVTDDQIDILVDLTMHMAQSRLLTFARKPAPVQVSYLAYCSTTGLDTIDCRLTDRYLDPAEDDEARERISPSPLVGEGRGEGEISLNKKASDLAEKAAFSAIENRSAVPALTPHPSPLPQGERGPERAFSPSLGTPEEGWGERENAADFHQHPYYSERSAYLESYWCYQPGIETPAVNPLPALSRGYVTFGSLNNFTKISPATIELWTRLLHAVPKSRVILHALEGSHRDRLIARFAAGGIARDRLELVGMKSLPDFFGLHHKIDLALDPFPYPGGTTTCDGLWMGVPTITLVGKAGYTRSGLSILSNAGLSELAAFSAEEYLRIAVELANDLPRLAKLRATMRDRMRASPLMDATKFAAGIETIYRKLWREWCG